MTLLNSYIHKDDFKTIFEAYIDFFREFGYGDLNNDALWKWSSILYSLEILGVKESDIVVDIGGGKSPIAKI